MEDGWSEDKGLSRSCFWGHPKGRADSLPLALPSSSQPSTWKNKTKIFPKRVHSQHLQKQQTLALGLSGIVAVPQRAVIQMKIMPGTAWWKLTWIFSLAFFFFFFPRRHQSRPKFNVFLIPTSSCILSMSYQSLWPWHLPDQTNLTRFLRIYSLQLYVVTLL